MSGIRSKVDNNLGIYMICKLRKDPDMASILNAECLFTKCKFYCVPVMKPLENQTKIYVNGRVRGKKLPQLCM